MNGAPTTLYGWDYGSDANDERQRALAALGAHGVSFLPQQLDEELTSFTSPLPADGWFVLFPRQKGRVPRLETIAGDPDTGSVIRASS
jgi:hypothetical protein